MEKKQTQRGFPYFDFRDHYDNQCSIQKSSLADTPCIWIGIDDAKPSIMASKAAEHGLKTDETTGWIPFPIPEDVSLSTRMHLNQKQAREVVKVLKRFIKTGDI